LEIQLLKRSNRIVLTLPQQAEAIRFAHMNYAAGGTATAGITLRKLVEDYGVLHPVPLPAPTPG
jgi:hypothetical protein